MAGKEKKINTEEFKKLVWDYTLTPEVFLSILSGKKTLGWFTQEWAIARVLENLDYYRAVDLIGFATLLQHWDQVKKSIHDPALKRGYEYALRANAVSSAR